MNRKLVRVGLVLFLIGVVLFVAGAYEAKSDLHTIGGFHAVAPGEFVSSEVNLTSGATITIENAPSGMGVVSAANLSGTNATNMAQRGETPTGTSAGATVYILPAGSYYVVDFASSAPSNMVDYLYTSAAVVEGLATLVGLGLLVAGGIVGLVGAFKRSGPKPPNPFEIPPPLPPST